MDAQLLLEWAARATLPLVGALLIARLARGPSAAQRHWLFLVALIAAACLPVAGAFAPDITLPVLTPQPAPVETANASFVHEIPTGPLISEVPAPLPPAPLPTIFTLKNALLLLWLGGIALLATRRFLDRQRLARFAAGARIFDDSSWNQLALSCSRAIGLRTPVQFLLHPDAATPATWGCFRPVVLLPTEALGWSAGRRRAILLHELGHIRRRDVFTQQVADLICILLWIHPLVWQLAARMRVEREKACDDLVLACGARPSGYAAALFDLYRRLDAARFPSHAAAACSLPRPDSGAAGIERRLIHVLDPMQSHDQLSGWKAARAALFVALLALPAAALQVGERAPAPQDSKRTSQDPVKRAAPDKQKPKPTPARRASAEDVEKRLQDLLDKHKKKKLAPKDLEAELRRLVEGAGHGSNAGTDGDAVTKRKSDKSSKRAKASDSSRSSDSSSSGSSSSSSSKDSSASSNSGTAKGRPPVKRKKSREKQIILGEKTLIWSGRGLPTSKELDDLTSGMPVELRIKLKGMVGDMRRDGLPSAGKSRLLTKDKLPPKLQRQVDALVDKQLKELGIDPKDVKVIKPKSKTITTEEPTKKKVL